MFRLTLFEALLITHLVMDWIFQWKWEAFNKAKKWSALLFHCFIYTMGFIPVFLVYKVNLIWLLVIFLSHVILDRRTFEIWLIEKFKRFKKEKVPEPLWWIILIGVDQTLHFVVLAVIVLLF